MLTPQQLELVSDEYYVKGFLHGRNRLYDHLKATYIYTTHRQRLMYGVNLNMLAERRAALHFKATRLQARAVDAASRIDASNVMKR